LRETFFILLEKNWQFARIKLAKSIRSQGMANKPNSFTIPKLAKVRSPLKIPTENQEQRAFIKYIREHKPELAPFVVKITNELQGLSIGQGCNLKLLGLNPGASDIFIAKPSGGFCGAWIEMKRRKQYTKSEQNTECWLKQVQFLDLMRENGYFSSMSWGAEHAIKLLDEYLRQELYEPVNTRISNANYWSIPDTLY
jgi:hypothetical protein